MKPGSLRTASVIGALTVVWVLLWGSLSVANVTSGVIVAALLLVVFPQERSSGRVGRPRPIAVARLAAFVIRNLIVSNVVVTIAIIRPRLEVDSTVIECPLRTRSPRLITTLANILALSPGTIPVDVREDPVTGVGSVVVHVLDERNVDPTRASIARLETLLVRAFGNDEDVARCTMPVPTHVGGVSG